MGGHGNEGNWRGKLVVLDVDAADESIGSVVVPYWFRLVCKLTSSVVMVIRWWTPVSAVGDASRALGLAWGGGAVSTNPWTGSGF